VDARLRLAVQASRAWYDDVFALHGVPTASHGGLWRAGGDPPAYHSVVKTLVPGVPSSAALEAAKGRGSVADSFADLDLPGFTRLFEATWVHHAGDALHGGSGPAAWSVVRTPEVLSVWSERHDYVGVLPPAVLDRPAFTVLGRFDGGELVGGAVVHDGSAAVGLSNAWSLPEHPLDWEELLAAASAVHPGRALTDYAADGDLHGMLGVGFDAVGTQRVWGEGMAPDRV
jgi:hypothetical protein